MKFPVLAATLAAVTVTLLQPSSVRPNCSADPRTPIKVANTPGDSLSVYRIIEPGSYSLTGPVRGKAGIAIAASGVTIDLMGFPVTGVAGSEHVLKGHAERDSSTNALPRRVHERRSTTRSARVAAMT